MICNKCGIKFAEGNFCPECGSRLEEDIIIIDVNSKEIGSESEGGNKQDSFKLKKIILNVKDFVVTILALAGVVISILALTGKLDKFAHEISGGAYGDPGERWIEKSPTEKESETETSTYNNMVEMDNDYFYLGEEILYTSGAKVIVTDAAVYSEGQELYIYVDLEVENTGNEEGSFSYMEVKFYGDDYLLNYGYPIETDAEVLSYVNLSPGRKYSGRVYAVCPNFDNLSKIEVEIGDAVVLLMDVNADEWKYSCNDSGLKRSATITETEDGSMYINLSAYNMSNELQASFYGMLLTTLDGNYYVAQKDFLDETVVFKVTFSDKMEIEVEATNDNMMYFLEGKYMALY